MVRSDTQDDGRGDPVYRQASEVGNTKSFK